MRGQIIGVKKFSGNIEGKEFDYCRIIVATPLDVTQGNALGMSAVEYNYGASAISKIRNSRLKPIWM